MISVTLVALIALLPALALGQQVNGGNPGEYERPGVRGPSYHLGEVFAYKLKGQQVNAGNPGEYERPGVRGPADHIGPQENVGNPGGDYVRPGVRGPARYIGPQENVGNPGGDYVRPGVRGPARYIGPQGNGGNPGVYERHGVLDEEIGDEESSRKFHFEYER